MKNKKASYQLTQPLKLNILLTFLFYTTKKTEPTDIIGSVFILFLSPDSTNQETSQSHIVDLPKTNC